MNDFRTRDVVAFQRITGLKAQYAKECFTAFNGYSTALASFAQSYTALPRDHFENTDEAIKNRNQINDELRLIYRCVRELKAKSGKTDEEVWRDYEKEKDTPAAPVNPFLSSFKSTSILDSQFKVNQITASAKEKNAALPSAGFTLPSSTSPTPPAVFSFKAASSANPFTFSFGKVETPSSATFMNGATLPSAFASFGKPAAESSPHAAVATADHKPPPTVRPPKHFTGPYFEMPDFWAEEVEKRAPLLNLNNGFIEAHRYDLRARMEKWLQKASFYRQPVKYVDMDDEDEEIARVIIKDAERTFFAPAHRAKLVEFLYAMYHEFKNYGQAMSYLAALCMLTLSEEEAAAIIRFVSTEYIKGHWAAEAVGFATSAWVVEFFMQKKFPDVATHLESLNFWPDTYLQKILTGLCIHVLQFNELFEFLDAFIEGGLRFLIQFCLSVVEHYRSALLAIRSSIEADTLYEIMRLDRNVADRSDVRAILDRAQTMSLGEDGNNIDLIRSQVYEKKVESRLKRAPKTDTFEPCVVCENSRPKWWNEDLGAVCDSCRSNNKDISFEKY